jgi:hypothetical protein
VSALESVGYDGLVYKNLNEPDLDVSSLKETTDPRELMRSAGIGRDVSNRFSDSYVAFRNDQILPATDETAVLRFLPGSELTADGHVTIPADQAQFIFAGAGARGFDEAVAEGRAFTSPYDQLPRFEIFDYPSKIRKADQLIQPLGKLWSKADKLLTDLRKKRKESSLTPLEKKTFQRLKELSQRQQEAFSMRARDTGTWRDHFLDRPGVTLGKLLDHPELYQAYPDLADLRVYPRNDRGKGAHYSSAKDEIRVDLDIADKDFLSTLLHEVQHAVQEREDFAKGSNLVTAFQELLRQGFPEDIAAQGAYHRYQAHAGEIEAAEVQRRLQVPPEALQRADRPFGNAPRSEEAVLRFMPKVPPGTPDVLRDKLRSKVRQAFTAFPEALPLKYATDEGKVRLDRNGEPIPVQVDYDLAASPLAKDAAKGIRGEEPRKRAIAEAYANAIVNQFSEVQNNPSIMAGQGWYKLAREKIKKVFGKDDMLFAELLAATSPRTSVDQNFSQALDAYNKFKAGEYSRNIKKYLEGRSKLKSGKLQTEAAKALKMDEVTEARAMDWWIDKHDLLPKKLNDQKFNTNSRKVLQVMAGTWREEAQGLKAKQFADNLAGTDMDATIDVWAARALHRLGHEGRGKDQWRILPENEPGVNDADFTLAQDAYRLAAAELGMSPDDLQAVLWFGEKDIWDRRGWTRGTGAAKSDFHSLLDSLKAIDSGAVIPTEDRGQRVFELDPLALRGRRERRERSRPARRDEEETSGELQAALSLLPARAPVAPALAPPPRSRMNPAERDHQLGSAVSALDALTSVAAPTLRALERSVNAVLDTLDTIPQRRLGRAAGDEDNE